MRYVKISGERTATEGAQINSNRLLILYPIMLGYGCGSIYFALVALSIVKRKCM